MWARRLQLYWFPIASTLGVAACAVFLDLPPYGALVRTEHGAQLGRFDTTGFVAWSLAILVTVWVAQAVTDRPRKPSPVSHLAYYAASGILYADLLFFAGGHGRTAAQAGVSLWPFAGLVPVVWLGNHAAAKLEDARARLEGAWDAGPSSAPSLRLGPSESVLWVGRRVPPGYPWTWLLAPPLLVALIVLIFRKPGGVGFDGAIMLAFHLGLLAYGVATATARVTVTQSAVRVEGGPLRIPLWTIPIDDLVQARAEDLRPRHYGGYGYRAKAGRRCLVVRAGPALVLRRRRGRDVVVTVEGADEGAAVVNALVERRRPAVATPG